MQQLRISRCAAAIVGFALMATGAGCSSGSTTTGNTDTTTMATVGSGSSSAVSSIESSAVAAAFAAADLEATEPRPMTREDYGMAPYVATEGTRFLIPSIGTDSGGRILTFANNTDLQDTRSYYDDLGRSSAALYSYTFVNGNVLVQINGELPEAKAQQYNDALQAMSIG